MANAEEEQSERQVPPAVSVFRLPPFRPTRNLADRIGAIIGTITGLGLAIVLFAIGPVTSFVVIGENFNPSPLGRVIGFFLTVGFCSNLGRNGAVGVHDTIKYSLYTCRWIYRHWKKSRQKRKKKKEQRERELEMV